MKDADGTLDQPSSARHSLTDIFSRPDSESSGQSIKQPVDVRFG